MKAFKLPSAAASKLTIGTTAVSLEKAIEEASGDDTVRFSFMPWSKANSIDSFVIVAKDTTGSGVTVRVSLNWEELF